jgi:hypothetical protein
LPGLEKGNDLRGIIGFVVASDRAMRRTEDEKQLQRLVRGQSRCLGWRKATI